MERPRGRLDCPHLHVESLRLLDERRGHRQQHDVRIQVIRAVIGVVAPDALLVVLLDDGGDHVEPRQAEDRRNEKKMMSEPWIGETIARTVLDTSQGEHA